MNDIQIHYKKILCPVDFSDCSRRAFYKAVGYCKLFGSELVVLHVREDRMAQSSFDDIEAEDEELTRLEKGLVRRLDELERDGKVTREERDRMSLEIRGGRPYLEILRFASKNDVDLIVMGTHGHTGFKHIFMGSQAEKVVRRAPCDVISVKPEGYDPRIDVTLD